MLRQDPAKRAFKTPEGSSLIRIIDFVTTVSQNELRAFGPPVSSPLIQKIPTDLPTIPERAGEASEKHPKSKQTLPKCNPSAPKATQAFYRKPKTF